MIPNTVEYAVLLWACALMRLTLAAIDPAVLEERDQLPDYIENLKPEVIFASGTNGPPAIDLAISKCPGLCQPSLRVLIGGDTNCVFRQWKPFWNLLRTEVSASVSSGNELAPIEEARRDDPKRIHSILFTSGTSASRPKGCPLTVRSMTHILNSQSWLINANNCARVLQQAHNARAIASYHTLQTWRVGGAVVMSTGRSFAIQHTLDAIRNHGVTFMVLSPAMVHAIAPALLSLGCAADSVRAIQVGGDAVTKEVLARCTALFPRAQVFINHGMSEGGGFFTWPFFDTPIAQIPYLGEICPVGSVARGTHVRIWNSERKSTALFRQPGELHISCDSLISGYINGVEGSSFYLDDSEMHWINTGDVAMATEEGLVYILGRCKDAIKRGGVAIMPAALESCIENYTGAQVRLKSFLRIVALHQPFNSLFFLLVS
jgi:4-coumarate--CoA ligase